LHFASFALQQRSASGELLRRVQLPLILHHEGIDSLKSLEEECDEPSYSALILLQAGRASLAIVKGDVILVSKQIQKYMVRKSQGKAQLTYLNQKGKSRLGSRIRLRQTEAFFEEINEYLGAWARQYDVKTLFLSCTPRLKGAWFQSDPPFDKDDARWRSVPFTVHPPKESEMQRIHWLLCRAIVEEINDQDFFEA
jgi:hypothetical protein